MTYDARFQAANIEEAMLTFVDTTMDFRIFEEQIGGPIVCKKFKVLQKI